MIFLKLKGVQNVMVISVVPDTEVGQGNQTSFQWVILAELRKLWN